MSTINLASVEDGMSGEDAVEIISNNFFSQSSDSLAVINGSLDQNFINSLAEITYRHVQTPAFSNGAQVGGTANLDYFSGGGTYQPGSGWFDGVAENPANNPKRWLAIPGANQRIYLPYNAYVLVFWSITWANDSNFSSKQSHIGFFVNGEPAYSNYDFYTPNDQYHKNPCVRRIARSQFGRNSKDPDTEGDDMRRDKAQDRYKTRVYSGHYFTPSALSAGFHDIGLQICCSAGDPQKFKQTRIRARSLKYIYFRKGATF